MIYPYTCNLCKFDFEVIKSVRHIEDPESCPECNAPDATRTIAESQSFSGADDWDTAHFSPALGKVVRNNTEARKLAREAGMTEVGTEPLDKIHKKFDNDRAEKLSSSYDSINMDHGNIKSSNYES